jgi:acetyltransferase-like isoleucine patch superfamily enzyme/glycosyltransferase involved in cell wall biosynthesis
VERIWGDLAHEFAARGHRVTLVARRHPALRDFDATPGLRLRTVRGFEAGARLGTNLLRDFVYSARAAWAARGHDIVVTNGFWLPLWVRLLSPRAKIHVQVQRVPKGQMGFYALIGVHRFAAVSSAIAAWIREESAAAGLRTRTFPNAIRLADFHPAPRDGRGTKRIVFTGRLHPEKGVHLLVEAVAQLAREGRDVCLRLVGPWEAERGGGGAEYRARLLALAEGAPVELVPATGSTRELGDHLRAAHVYCYPSLAAKGEASPVAPVEAMATGAITVTTDLPQFGDYLRDGEEGFTVPLRGISAETLARALAKALDLPPADRERISAAAILSAQRFGVAACADIYLEDFRTLMGQTPDAPDAKPRIATRAQSDPYSSPWSASERVMMGLWPVLWMLLARWTPKPLSAWRVLLLKLFGARVKGRPFVASSAIVKRPWALTLEHRACLGPGAEVYNLGEAVLRARCTVAQQAYLCGGSHDFEDPRLPLTTGAIEIGADAFIGARAMVLPGVRVGEGAVVGAGSVVTKDVPEWTYAAGNPCRTIRPRGGRR